MKHSYSKRGNKFEDIEFKVSEADDYKDFPYLISMNVTNEYYGYCSAYIKLDDIEELANKMLEFVRKEKENESK